MKVFEHSGNEFAFGAGAIEVFVAKDEGSAVGLSALLGNPECAGVSEVQEACG
jgi:hypothetical protein